MISVGWWQSSDFVLKSENNLQHRKTTDYTVVFLFAVRWHNSLKMQFYFMWTPTLPYTNKAKNYLIFNPMKV